jgi:predicted DNA-binding protein
MNKNDGNIGIHLPTEQRLAFKRLAESMGKTESELGRELVQSFLLSKLSEYRLLDDVFGSNGSLSSLGTDLFGGKS